MFVRARRQLTLIYAVSAILMFAVLTAGLMLIAVSLLDREIDRDIEHVLVESADMVDPDGGPAAVLDVPTAFGPVFLIAFSPDGEVIHNPRDLPAYRVVPTAEVRLAALSGEDRKLTPTVDGERYRLHLQPVYEGTETLGVLVAGRSLARRDAEVRVFGRSLLVSGAVWVVLASVAAYVIAGRALRPVREAYLRQEEFVAGAAHELRSPIGVIRAASDVALRSDPASGVRDLLTEINSVAQDASDLVDTLLELARLRPEGASEHGESDLAEVVARELTRMDLLLREHQVRVVDDLEAARISVPAADVARVTRALLENVLQHTPRGTHVLVRTRDAGGAGTLIVEDNGPGVPPEQLATVFDPFTRGDEARQRERRRTGLGLAIVQSIAEHHGGNVVAHPSAVGTGLVLEVSFPTA